MREVRKGGRQQDGKEKGKRENEKEKGSWWEDIIKVELERKGRKEIKKRKERNGGKGKR